MEENPGPKMRYAIVLALFVFAPVYAQTAADNFAIKVQEEYRKAKNAEEVASVTTHCKARISSFSFKERDALSVQAIKLLEANKIEEANVLFRKVNALEESDVNLGEKVCRKISAIH
jgi:hypothetical protein